MKQHWNAPGHIYRMQMPQCTKCGLCSSRCEWCTHDLFLMRIC
jgi:MinD superfamily P-loop ATPase